MATTLERYYLGAMVVATVRDVVAIGKFGVRVIVVGLKLPVFIVKQGSHTLYGFGIEPIDRLLRIIHGEQPSNPTQTEKVFVLIGQLPAGVVLQWILLPFFATAALLFKQLLMKFYSTVGQFAVDGSSHQRVWPKLRLKQCHEYHQLASMADRIFY